MVASNRKLGVKLRDSSTRAGIMVTDGLLFRGSGYSLLDSQLCREKTGGAMEK